jgi:hypothetical protein
MWIFTPGGLLMPATLPNMRHDGVEVAKRWTRNGKFDFQVRARVKSHLENFIRDYMDPMKLPHSQIQATPRMDYDFRFYCTQQDFADAMRQALLDVDYQKFKPTAERKNAQGEPLYPDGRKYHDLLNQLWGSIARLGNPYGSNRKGFWGGGAELDRAPATHRASWKQSTPDFTPIDDPNEVELTQDELAEELYKQLTDVPHSQWSDFAPAADLENVERWLEQTGKSEAVHEEKVAAVVHSIDEEPPF